LSWWVRVEGYVCLNARLPTRLLWAGRYDEAPAGGMLLFCSCSYWLLPRRPFATSGCCCLHSLGSMLNAPSPFRRQARGSALWGWTV